MLAFLIAFLTLIVIGYMINTLIKPRKFPPGPRWYPFVGSSNAVHNATLKYGSQFKGLIELSKEYSTEVLGLKLGNELVVVVYGEKNVRQVFLEKTFEGRPNSFFLRLRCLGKKMGITFTDGPLWKIHRQFTMTQLRNVGFGKTPMEKEIQIELHGIVNYLKNYCHKPISPNNFVSQAVMNVLWKFVADWMMCEDGPIRCLIHLNFVPGEKIKEDKWKHMQDLFRKRSKAFTLAGGLLNQIPWCRFFIPNLSGYTLITKLNRQIAEIIEEAINKHKNGEIDGKDFIYSFMQEMSDDKDSFTEEQLKMVCLDMLIAGAQTTSNLLEFAFLEVLRNKRIQEKIYDEIEQTLGDNTPSWTDLSKLTYTSAFLLELQRYHPIAPLAGPRRVLQDTFIDGFLIPKETTVLISLGGIHFDPELWDDPHVFKPERFIDERGVLKNAEHMYPFGLGRRRCPGDTLAKSFIFITLVGILQHFRIDCCNGVVPTNEPVIGLIAAPQPYKADFVPRK